MGRWGNTYNYIIGFQYNSVTKSLSTRKISVSVPTTSIGTWGGNNKYFPTALGNLGSWFFSKNGQQLYMLYRKLNANEAYTQ